MYSIFLDTHDEELKIVLFKNHESLFVKTSIFNNQSKYIIPSIVEVLENNNISFDNIEEVIVVNGPGSFTGVRMGVTIAKTIAYSLNIPIKSISSLMLKAINIKSNEDYSVAISDNKGYYVGQFNKENKPKKDYFYMLKSEFEEYKKDHIILNEELVNWDYIYEKGCLIDEDYYNIKPVYIKKIEVQK